LLNNAFLTYGFYKKKLDLEFIQRVWFYLEWVKLSRST
jgi:hypothetical protein